MMVLKGGTAMNWREHIVSDPDTLFGKPRIKGTRIGVEFILNLMTSGWSPAQILDSYPHLQPEDLQAMFAYIQEFLLDETVMMRSIIKLRNIAQ
ncbi:MAG: DUF433 domain-containing protein [Burkholderiales bacterium]